MKMKFISHYISTGNHTHQACCQDTIFLTLTQINDQSQGKKRVAQGGVFIYTL